MGGFFGAVSKRDVVLDVFFGVDYHSHLGTRRAGMVFCEGTGGFQKEIHSIENTPFRSRFDKDLERFHGTSGIGCISDTDPQPLLVRGRHGIFAITTVGAITNADELIERYFEQGGAQFMAMSSGAVNHTELVAALINQKDDLVEGIVFAQKAMIHKYAGKLLAHCLCHHNCCNRRVNAAGQRTQHAAGANLFPDFLNRFFHKGIHLPVSAAAADAVNEVGKHLRSLLGMHYLWMELNGIPVFLRHFHSCYRADRSMACHSKALRGLQQIQQRHLPGQDGKPEVYLQKSASSL